MRDYSSLKLITGSYVYFIPKAKAKAKIFTSLNERKYVALNVLCVSCGLSLFYFYR